ncbi:uncharacterized protein LOC135499076 [Lineus longissimus]|uniref:uncharacterized protein LOC135499076 n=1 Tax=Lineus longissimus TaxID=88925 RepID=UPI002B4E74C0
MTNRSPLGSPRLTGRLWRQQSVPKRQAVFVPCPVAPPLHKPVNDDVTDNNVINDDANSLNVPNNGYPGRLQSGLATDYPEPFTSPVHLSEIIRQSSEEQDIEDEGLLPPQPLLEMTTPSTPSPPPRVSGPSGASTPPSPSTPKTPTTPTSSPKSKHWKILPKDLAKKSNIFRFPPEKKTSAVSKIRTEEASLSPPVPWTPPPGPQMLQKQTSEVKTESPRPSPRPLTAPPPPPSLRPKKGATINQEDVTAELPEFPSTPPSRTPSIDVTSEFPPPPPGVGADDEPASPSYIIPRKPPRPNSGFLAKIKKFNEAKKPSEIAAEERKQRNKSDCKIDEKLMKSGDGGHKNDDERISVALHNSLEDLLSHINEALPGIDEHPTGTPPETKTPANSLESSQEFLDHVGLFLATPGRDMTAITEEDMATKFDDANAEISAASSDANTFAKQDADEGKNDVNKLDEVFAKLDDVNAQFDEVVHEKPVLDEDFAAFLGLDDLDDCLNQINEAIATPNCNQATASNQASEASLRTKPTGGAGSGDSDDSEDYDYPIGNKATFSGPLPPGSNSRSEDPKSQQATLSEHTSDACLPTLTTGGVDSDDSDDSKDYEFPVGNQWTFSGALPSGSFSETPDDPYYENSAFLRTLRDSNTGRTETPDPPQYQESDDVDYLPMDQNLDPSPDDYEMNCPDEDQVGLYDIPQPVQQSLISGVPELEAEVEYEVLDVTDDITNAKKKKEKKKKQTSLTSASRTHEQTKTSSPKFSKDRPPPPNDVPPKPQVKKTGKKKTWSWRKKSEKPEKVANRPPLPPKDPDMLQGPRPVLEVEEEQYCCVDDIISRAQPETGVIGDDDWNSDDDEIFDDFEDWD